MDQNYYWRVEDEDAYEEVEVVVFVLLVLLPLELVDLRYFEAIAW